jgi:hypothetical protein
MMFRNEPIEQRPSDSFTLHCRNEGNRCIFEFGRPFTKMKNNVKPISITTLVTIDRIFTAVVGVVVSVILLSALVSAYS